MSIRILIIMNQHLKTYYIDLTSAKWNGTKNELRIQFKNSGNTDFTAVGGEKIDIDKIEFMASMPTTLQETFTFDTDGDKEGFEAKSATTSGPVNGTLTFTPQEK